MRKLWGQLTKWSDGWWGIPLGMGLGFAAAAFVGLVLLDHDADYDLPMAAAAAIGCGIGQMLRLLWPRKTKAPAWPASTAPPPGRPD